MRPHFIASAPAAENHSYATEVLRRENMREGDEIIWKVMQKTLPLYVQIVSMLLLQNHI